MGTLQVDPSQVQAIHVDPSQVQAMQKQSAAYAPAAPQTWGNLGHAVLSSGLGILKVLGETSPPALMAEGVKETYQAVTGQHVDTPKVVQMALDLLKSHANEAQQAYQAAQNGQYSEALGHSLAAVTPMVGPMAAHLATRFAGAPPAYDKYGNVVTQGQHPDPTGAIGEAIPQVALAAAVPAARAVDEIGAGVRGVDAGAGVADAAAGPGVPAAPAAEAAPVAGGGLIKSTLNPTQQGAVDYLRSQDVPLNAGTVTGNKFVKGAQALVQNQPLGARVAADAARATEQGLTRVAGDLADQAHPNPATPESAGAAVGTELNRQIANLKLHEDEAYGDAWAGANDPANAVEVPVKTVQRPIYDATGKDTGQTEAAPVMAKVQMPVDVRGLKQQLAPVMDSMSWMPASDQASSAGFQAVKKILAGPDFIPAQAAEQGLSGLKTMARTPNANLRNTSQGMAAGIIPDLQEGIDAAVAKTGDTAIRSLQDGRAFHADKMGIAEVADQLRDEPVQAFNQLTWRNDTGIEFLRKIGQQAPEVLPQVGRAFVQKLFDQATQEGGFGRAQGLLNQWENLGPQTKQMLYPNPGLRGSLDNFFLGAKMVAENPNPSGTAVVAQLIPGGMLMVHNPVLGTGYLLGGYAAAKLLFSPAGVRLLTGGLRPAASVGAAGMAAAQIMRIAGDDDVRPIPPGGGPPSTPPAGSGGGSAAGVNPKPGGAAEVLNQGPEASTVETPIGAANGDSGPQPNDDSLPVQHAGGDRGAPAVQGQPGPVAGTPSRTSATTIPIPGSRRAPYQAKYAVRELDSITTSHNGLSFARNEGFKGLNDRDYTIPESQAKVMFGSDPATFDPRYFVNNGPDMGSGPPAWDSEGQVHGGNGRGMMLQRMYAYNPEGAQAYRELLIQHAGLYGQDPAEIAAMRQPVLGREVADSETATPEARQRAITDFNASGTADLTPAENAMADARRVSQATRDDIGRRMNALGPQGTLPQVLGGPGGVDVLNNMIRDGVVNQQEVAALKAGNALTEAGKARISQALTGRFYTDTEQMAATVLPVRTRIERIAGPLTDLDADPKWTLTPTVQGALELLREASANKNTLAHFVKTGNIFGRPAYSPRVIEMAKTLQSAPLPELKDAAEIYAQDAAADGAPEGMFGKPAVSEPADAFTRALKVADLNAQETKLVGTIRKLGETGDDELSEAGKATRDSKLETARQALVDVRAKRAAL